MGGARWRLPADFEPHDCTWLAWPDEHHVAGYPLEYERTFLELAGILERHEPLRICAWDDAQADHIRHQLAHLGLGTDNVEILVVPTNDIWICHCGPLVVIDEAGERAIVNWRFNGWGERNPHLSQQEIEAEFEEFLGVTNTIWLAGVDGNDPVLGPEETDCHVDLLCRFVAEDTVLYGWHEQYDEGDPAFRRVFQVMLDELRNARTENDKPLELVSVPAPKHPVYSTNPHAAVGRIAEAGRGVLAACGPEMWYCGYLDWHVANGVAVVPILGDENDERALG